MFCHNLSRHVDQTFNQIEGPSNLDRSWTGKYHLRYPVLYTARPPVRYMVCVCHFRNVKHQLRGIKSLHNHHHHRIKIWIHHKRECNHINNTRIAASIHEFYNCSGNQDGFVRPILLFYTRRKI